MKNRVLRIVRSWLIGLGIGVCALQLATPPLAIGQSGRMTRSSLADLGLEKSWSAQTASLQSSGLMYSFHTSQDRFRHVFDLVSAKGMRSFAEGDLGPGGAPMSREEAERQADIARRTLQLDGIEATVSARQIPELTLVVQSPSGQVQAIDAETGQTKWQIAIGRPGEPGFAPATSDALAAAVSGSTLYVSEVETGKLTLKRPTTNIPGGGPLITDDYVFVPLFRGAMEIFPLDPDEAKSGSMFLPSHGRPTARPTRAGSVVCWPTDRGAVYFANIDSASDLFRVRTRGQIVGQVAFAPPHLFFVGTDDGYLVCIDQRRQGIIWDYLLGSACSGTPYVLGDAVFAVDRESQLHCVDTELGIERWKLQGVRRTGPGLENRLYVQLVDGRLAIVDVSSGDVLAATPMSATAELLSNATTDRLYFSEGGRISCYRDVDHPWPTIYTLVEQPVEEESKPGSPGEPTEPASEPVETPVKDPFGTGDEAGQPDENPFGGDAGSDDPFSGDAGGNDDPFSGDPNPFRAGQDVDPFRSGGSGGDGGGDGGNADNPFG